MLKTLFFFHIYPFKKFVKFSGLPSYRIFKTFFLLYFLQTLI
nr:MAG TPA: hypothetical protein [Caudoviricetes sp.]